MGVHPRVAGSTGMYLVLFSTINSCAVYFINSQLLVWYGFWVSLWSIFGTIGGLLLADWYAKKSGRTSIFVWVLVFMFGLSCIVIPLASYGEIAEDKKNGADIWSFSNFCNCHQS